MEAACAGDLSEDFFNILASDGAPEVPGAQSCGHFPMSNDLLQDTLSSAPSNNAHKIPRLPEIARLLREELSLPEHESIATTISRASNQLGIQISSGQSLMMQAYQCFKAIEPPASVALPAPAIEEPDRHLNLRDIEEMTTLWSQELDSELSEVLVNPATMVSAEPQAPVHVSRTEPLQPPPTTVAAGPFPSPLAVHAAMPMALSAVLPIAVSTALPPASSDSPLDEPEKAPEAPYEVPPDSLPVDDLTELPRPCSLCRRSKILCDRQAPCGRCTRLGIRCTIPPTVRRGRPPCRAAPQMRPKHEGISGEGHTLGATLLASAMPAQTALGLDALPYAFARGMERMLGRNQPVQAAQPLAVDRTANPHGEPLSSQASSTSRMVAARRGFDSSHRRGRRLVTVDLSADSGAALETKARPAQARQRTWHDDEDE
jgi:hypothetical protein